MTRGRGGFTLIELAIVLLVIGVLSGIAVPNLRSAVAQADAAAVVSQVASIRNAAYRHLGAEGRFPSSGAWGEMPPEFAGPLSQDYPFTYEGILFRWTGVRFPFDFLGNTHLGILMLDMRQQPWIAAELEDESGPSTYWSPSIMYFIYWG